MMDRLNIISLLRETIIQLNEIIDQVEETDECIEVILHIRTVQTSLRAIQDSLLEGHLDQCLAVARQHNYYHRSALDEILDVFYYINRRES